MKFRYILTVLMGVALMVGFLGGSISQATNQEPVKIGILAPLSPPGDYEAGQLFVRGAQLAEEYVNNVMGGVLGGRPIKVVIEDDSGQPEKGVAAFRKLVTQDKVIAVTGLYHSSVAVAVVDVAEELGVPVLITQASATSITEKHLMTTFRTHALGVDRAKTWLGFIQKMGWKRIALLAENTDYGLDLIEATRHQKPADMKLKIIVFDRTVSDLTPQLLMIKDWKPDLVINIGVGAPAYLIIKQAYDIGLYPAVPMLSSYDFPARPEYWENLGDKGNYQMFISYYHPNMKVTKIGEWLKAKYTEKYNEPPLYSSYNCFGDVVILAEAINLANSDKPADLVKALTTGKFLTWNGTATFPPGEGALWHQWSPPLLILQYNQTRQAFKDATILWPPEYKTGEYTSP